MPRPDCSWNPGETLVLYTDGLTEAMNTAGECFGTGQLLAASHFSGGDEPVQPVQRVITAVAAHVGDADQNDDLTLLAVTRRVSDSVAEVAWNVLCRPAEPDRLLEWLEPIRRAAENAGLAEAQVSRLELAVEEALVNVSHHAYADRAQPGPVYCRIAVQPEGLLIEIADEGPPFDPLVRTDPDTTLELEERQPGGLGVFLIKTLVSEVRYRREEGRNVLTLLMLKTGGQPLDE